jgi:hypothetical protein
MKLFCALALIFVLNCRASFAIYGPSLARADKETSKLACHEAQFTQGDAIQDALQNEQISKIVSVLPNALKELKETAPNSSLYPSRAFCVHELVPSSLPADRQSRLSSPAALPALAALRSIGLDYFYYEPDASWTLRKDPVDLETLATKYLDSRWGRQAFLMMTHLGWSKGGCQEGPDQFRLVIQHGEVFLRRFPNSEVSNDVRLAVADAYATWWSLAQDQQSGKANIYLKGATRAKNQAIALYQICLQHDGQPLPQSSQQQAELRLKRLLSDVAGPNTYDYYCGDYAD